ncbi:hypothetical protein [Mucilaginibacter sp. dw_454]|uniref:hypothetical protein n=1 Tax=Mucilaginibacter sp. dw_454 TaxID=2720079 RepID=UPI001BD4781C|nr:hypothetical protein [Mucilaginibacter sp. dw_454]
MQNLIKDITIAADDSGILTLIFITEQRYVEALLNSMGDDLKISVEIGASVIKIFAPTDYGNSITEVNKPLAENNNWINVLDCHLWTVGFEHHGRTTLNMPPQSLSVDKL